MIIAMTSPGLIVIVETSYHGRRLKPFLKAPEVLRLTGTGWTATAMVLPASDFARTVKEHHMGVHLSNSVQSRTPATPMTIMVVKSNFVGRTSRLKGSSRIFQ